MCNSYPFPRVLYNPPLTRLQQLRGLQFDSLRRILTCLLLQTPPQLSPDQLSPDLLMRQRMLGISPPHALDSAEISSFVASSSSALISDEERLESQRAFITWLSRPPIELSICDTDITAAAHNLFNRRIKVMQVAEEGEEDPIELFDYDTFCCDAWHAQRRLLVGFPQVEGFEEVKMYMMLVGDEEGTMRLDNLFAVRKGEEEQRVEGGLHRWPERCTERVGRAGTEQQEEGEGQGAAEYINDADAFWAGFSDEEGDGDARAAVQMYGGAVIQGVAAEEREETEQQKAIKDIVRGAYTLHRSMRSHGSEQDSVEGFVRLVRSAIQGSGATRR